MMEVEARAHTGAKPQGRLCKPLMQVLDGPRVSCDGKSKKVSRKKMASTLKQRWLACLKNKRLWESTPHLEKALNNFVKDIRKENEGWAPVKCSAHEVSMALMEWAAVLTPEEMHANQEAKEDIANSTSPGNRSKKTVSRTSKTTSFVKQVISYGLKFKCS